MNSVTIQTSDNSRLFLFQCGLELCDPCPTYMHCVSIDGLSKDLGDITSVKCPSSIKYGEFTEVGTIRGEESRTTTTMTGRFSRTDLSDMIILARTNCRFDGQVHFGLCTNPSAFDAYEKIIVLEDIFVTSYGSDALIAINQGDVAEITETLDISIENFYEVMPIKTIERLASTDVLIDGVYIGQNSCGTICDARANKCDDFVAIVETGEIYRTTNNGLNWTLTNDMSVTIPLGISEWNDILWVADSGLNLNYIAVDDISGTVLSQNVFVTNPSSQDSGAFNLVVDVSGNAYTFTNPANTVAIHSLTSQQLNTVKFDLTGSCALLGGNNNTLFYTEDGSSFNEVDMPISHSDINISAVLPFSSIKWMVAYENGDFWCTEDGGIEWAITTGPSNVDAVTELAISTKHVIWATTENKVFKTLNGGTSWIELPENTSSGLGNSGGIVTVITCPNEANQIYVIAQNNVLGVNL